MERAARDHPAVLAQPATAVRFLGFGDSSLDLELLAWIGEPHTQYQVASDLNFAIDANFRAAGVTIPFPQRDLHLQMTDAVERLTGNRGTP
jgi:small-conductance mechanosensitive channel